MDGVNYFLNIFANFVNPDNPLDIHTQLKYREYVNARETKTIRRQDDLVHNLQLLKNQIHV